MKVGLIGWFGHGAYSDDFIGHVTKQLLLEVDSDIVFDLDLMSKCEMGTNPDYLNGFDLIIHAGGSLLGKCTHAPVNDITAWMDKVDTPIAIFGAGYRYEPDKEPLSPVRRRRLKTLFDVSQVISVRGCKTVQSLRANGVDTSKIDSVGDPVLACEIQPRRASKYIMGNVRNMPNIEVQHSSTGKVHKLMAEVYDWLIDHYELPLNLVSFRHSYPDDNDVTGARAVKKLMVHSDEVEVFAYPRFSNAIYSILNAAFWFGQRLHPSIFAGVHGIPFVGVEYQFDKMLDWMSTVGMDNVIHTATASLEDFIEAHSRVEENMARLRENLPDIVREIRLTARRIVELV